MNDDFGNIMAAEPPTVSKKSLKKTITDKQMEYLYQIRNVNFRNANSTAELLDKDALASKIESTAYLQHRKIQRQIARADGRLDNFDRKVTDQLVHCGLTYSPERRGMVVVKNNSVNVSPVRVSKSKSRAKATQQEVDQAPEDALLLRSSTDKEI